MKISQGLMDYFASAKLFAGVGYDLTKVGWHLLPEVGKGIKENWADPAVRATTLALPTAIGASAFSAYQQRRITNNRGTKSSGLGVFSAGLASGASMGALGGARFGVGGAVGGALIGAIAPMAVSNAAYTAVGGGRTGAAAGAFANAAVGGIGTSLFDVILSKGSPVRSATRKILGSMKFSDEFLQFKFLKDDSFLKDTIAGINKAFKGVGEGDWPALDESYATLTRSPTEWLKEKGTPLAAAEAFWEGWIKFGAKMSVAGRMGMESYSLQAGWKGVKGAKGNVFERLHVGITKAIEESPLAKKVKEMGGDEIEAMKALRASEEEKEIPRIRTLGPLIGGMVHFEDLPANASTFDKLKRKLRRTWHAMDASPALEEMLVKAGSLDKLSLSQIAKGLGMDMWEAAPLGAVGAGWAYLTYKEKDRRVASRRLTESVHDAVYGF